jgi:hypothetical protein
MPKGILSGTQKALPRNRAIIVTQTYGKGFGTYAINTLTFWHTFDIIEVSK